jgi:hypothetical protein
LKKKKTEIAFPRDIPYHCFEEFIAPDVDRFAFLKNLLDKVHLPYTASGFDGNRHLFVHPECLSFNRALAVIGYSQAAAFRHALAKSRITTVLTAHYDRAVNSPGANDNSIAVFELIKAALAFKKDRIGNWLIIFTDKEELKSGDSLMDQGSYALAKELKDSGVDKAQIFIFDCCGIGDTLIISTAVDHLIKNDESRGGARSRHLITQMRERALKTARNIRMERVLLVPTPFSDDAGFFRAGLAAQTITVLPAEEAAGLASFLRTKPDFASALVSKDVQDSLATGFIPQTWRELNGPGDTLEKLTPRYFQNIVDFAYALVCG